MSDLDHLLDAASEEIEGDFSHYFPSERLADLSAAHWRPGMLTHRRVRVLLEWLPQESAYKTWVRDNVPVKPAPPAAEPDFTGTRHSHTDDLLVNLYDAVVASSGAEDFKPSPRPQSRITTAAESGITHGMSREEQHARLEAVRANRGWG